MVTRRDVARKAGTSEAVVSYVINNGPRNVSPETRRRVIEAMRQVGYRANVVARSLRMNRTMSLGLVIPDNTNAFFADLCRVIEDTAFRRGFTLLLGHGRGIPEREIAYVRTLTERQVDGLIIVPSHGSHLWHEELSQSPTPCLVVDRQIEGAPLPHVLVDNRAGAYVATSHLLGHGRSRIGCVAGPPIYPTLDRVGGWRAALADQGLEPADSLLTYGPCTVHDGYQKGREILARSDRPDAIFVTSDDQARGVLRAAAELGIGVPDGMAMCSFDGTTSAAYTVPGITTIAQPVDLLGTAAVEILLQHITDRAKPAESTLLPTTLIRRRSCGCPEDSGLAGPSTPDSF